MTEPDCLSYAIEIERTRAPKDWPTALKAVPEQCRAECEEYLRGIAARIRVVRELKNGKRP
jgi:hypothetical protein